MSLSFYLCVSTKDNGPALTDEIPTNPIFETGQGYWTLLADGFSVSYNAASKKLVFGALTLTRTGTQNEPVFLRYAAQGIAFGPMSLYVVKGSPSDHPELKAIYCFSTVVVASVSQAATNGGGKISTVNLEFSQLGHVGVAQSQSGADGIKLLGGWDEVKNVALTSFAIVGPGVF